MYPHDRHEATGHAPDIAIRAAEPTDVRALNALAQLDERPLPAGTVLVALSDGRIRAALAVEDESLIADPFAATAELEDMLRLRADQLRGGHRHAHRGGLLSVLHLRAGRAA